MVKQIDYIDNHKKIRLFETELCYYLDLTAQQIRQNSLLFKSDLKESHPLREKLEPVFVLTIKELNNYINYAKILKTGMNQNKILELIEMDNKNNKLIETYALLSKEAPEGVTAHMMRSYCIVFLYQNRFNKMLLPKELSEIANIDYNTAKMHLKQLQHPDVNFLKLSQNPLAWEFNFVPKALSKYYK